MNETYEAEFAQNDEGEVTQTVTVARAAVASVLFKMQTNVMSRIQWREKYGAEKGSDPALLQHDCYVLSRINSAMNEKIGSLDHNLIWELAHELIHGTGSGAVGWNNRWMKELLVDTKRLGY